jgi:dihydroorotase
MEPFTEPAIDTDAQVQLVRHLAADSFCTLVPVAAATREKGALSEMALLRAAGAGAVSLGDVLPNSAAFLRSVLEYAAQNDLTVFLHPCDASLAAEGIVHEGPYAERLGLRGIPSVAEEIGLGTVLPLVRRTGARVHLSRLSTAQGVSMVRECRLEGLPVMADVSFRHLLQDESILDGFPSEWKLFPPLRTESDKRALWQGLLDGTLDAISSLHRPVPTEVKVAEFDHSPYGAIGLETCFSALRTAQPDIPPGQWVLWLSTGPRRVLGLPPANPDREGTWWDLEGTWVPDARNLASRSRNCPELGQTLLSVPKRLRRNGADIPLPDPIHS